MNATVTSGSATSAAVLAFTAHVREHAGDFEAALTSFVKPRRWFRSKSRPVLAVEQDRLYPLPADGFFVACVRVRYVDGGSDAYVIPLVISGPGGASVEAKHEIFAVESFVVSDGAENPKLLALLPALFATGAVIEARGAPETQLRFRTLPAFAARGGASSGAPPKLLGAEQTNTSVAFGDRFLLKIVRKLDDGASPDLEMGERMTARGFAQTPAVAGVVERLEPGHEPSTVAILSAFVPSQGDAWGAVTRDVIAWLPSSGDAIALEGGLLESAQKLADPALEARGAAFLGPWFGLARLLGQRTGEMHRALAEGQGELAPSESFVPEALAPAPFAAQLEKDLETTFARVETALPGLSGIDRADAGALLASRAQFARIVDELRASSSGGSRIRVHGDYHLGQVLFTGDDFSIIDFEGEPARSLAERKAKRSPLADVAGMIRSFDYAKGTGLRAVDGRMARAVALPRGEAWYRWIVAAYLRGYETALAGSSILPEPEVLARVLRAHLLEKALYELRYELDNRPDWVFLPLAGVRQLLET
jgi:trehalose synthase-fused probable maltokinase